MKPLVSIIIPTFNRAQLLGETLDSVIAQTYKNWECIVVDDGSKDYTAELLEFYCEKDTRIKFYYRPENRTKGANTCRNLGFAVSKGELIQWFDSDDLMLPRFLELKSKAIQESEVDFVISKTINFIDPDPENVTSWNTEYYTFDRYDITNYNFVIQKVHWLTPDFLGTRELCEKLKFNESLKSAQERNYFSQLTYHSVNAEVIDVYLTQRRIHTISTQSRLHIDEGLREKEHLEFLYETWMDLYQIEKSTEAVLYLFNNGLKITLIKGVRWDFILGYTKAFFSMNKYMIGFWYLSYQASFKIFKRGNFLRRRFLNLYKVV